MTTTENRLERIERILRELEKIHTEYSADFWNEIRKGGDDIEKLEFINGKCEGIYKAIELLTDALYVE